MADVADAPVSPRTQWLVWQACVGTVAGLFGLVVHYTLLPVHGQQVAGLAMGFGVMAVLGSFSHLKGQLETTDA